MIISFSYIVTRLNSVQNEILCNLTPNGLVLNCDILDKMLGKNQVFIVINSNLTTFRSDCNRRSTPSSQSLHSYIISKYSDTTTINTIDTYAAFGRQRLADS